MLGVVNTGLFSLESIKGELQSREGKGIVVGKESRRRARGRQARVAGLALLARPLVLSVVQATFALARLVDAAEDLAFGRARVRGLAAWNAGPKEI